MKKKELQEIQKETKDTQTELERQNCFINRHAHEAKEEISEHESDNDSDIMGLYEGAWGSQAGGDSPEHESVNDPAGGDIPLGEPIHDKLEVEGAGTMAGKADNAEDAGSTNTEDRTRDTGTGRGTGTGGASDNSASGAKAKERQIEVDLAMKKQTETAGTVANKQVEA